MDSMTEDRLNTATKHDYITAAGRAPFLPGYALLARVLGMHPAYDALAARAELADGLRVLEIGCGTGNVTPSASSVLNRVPTWSAPTRTPWRSPGRNGKHVGCP